MRLFYRISLAMLAAVLLGVGSAALTIYLVGMNAGVRNGPWVSSLDAGATDADPYTRAAIALVATFALNRSETIYFSAFEDDDGASLQTSCDYVLEGGELAARWWSLTVYAGDGYLVPNELGRYSYTMRTLQRDSDGRYQIHLSPDPHEGNWLPTGQSDSFSVALRLYNPEPELAAHPEQAALPSLRRVACR